MKFYQAFAFDYKIKVHASVKSMRLNVFKFLYLFLITSL